MGELRCSLAGTSFVVGGEDGLIATIAPSLAPLRMPGIQAPVFRCELRKGTPEVVPADARIHYEGTPPLADGPCVLGERGVWRFLVFPGRASLFVAPAKRRARLSVGVGEESSLVGFALMHLLDWVLAADGKTLVHGAAFADPTGERGLLVFAPSGTGKTTLALALLQAGFQLFSDDLAVLFVEDGEPRIGGLPRPLKVHRETLRLMPWLAAHLGGEDAWDAGGEQPISLDAAARLGTLRTEAVPLAAIVRLARSVTGRHRLRKVSAAEALMALSAQNVRTGIAGAPEFERTTFRRLGEIVADVRTYDFAVGSNLATAAPAIAAIVARGGAGLSRTVTDRRRR